MWRFNLLIILSGIIIYSTQASDNDKSKTHRRGDRAFYQEDFGKALGFFEEELAGNPENHDAIYKAEICSLLTRYGDKSMDILLSYEQTIGRRDRFYNYWLGRIYYRRHEFDEAQLRWETFLKSKSSKSAIIIEETRDFINRSRKAEKHQLNPSSFVITRLDDHINSSDAEIAPVMVGADSVLLFAAKSDNSTKRKDKYNIYYSTYSDDNWGNPQDYTSEDIYVSGGTSLQLLNNGSTLFFNSVKKRSDIFYIDRDSEEWSAMSSLAKKINRYGNDVTFFITEDLDYIIFASNRYTNNGDMDLFESYRIGEDQWAKPLPLTLNVNSPYDELSPYLSSDEGTLFFSSKGHNSLGGYDVFMSSFDYTDSTWNRPVNLGYPINSVEDDLYFQIAHDEKSGFLSSNRFDSRGSMDLYFFFVPEVEVEGVIAWDDESLVHDATISFSSLTDNMNTLVSKSNENGEYANTLATGQTYLVTIDWNDKEWYREEWEIAPRNVKLETLQRDFMLQKEEVVDSLTLTGRQLLAEIMARLEFPDVHHIHEDHREDYPVLNTYLYFDFDQDVIVPASEVTLSVYTEILKTHDDLLIEITGHTDHIGTYEYNLDLSRRRSEHVEDYFLSHGIMPERLHVSHAGEEELFIEGSHPEIHKVNRRVELILIHHEE